MLKLKPIKITGCEFVCYSRRDWVVFLECLARMGEGGVGEIGVLF